MKLKIDEIIIRIEYLPRKTLDIETIERYKEAYDISEKLPPIVVQKEKKILIDGFHRFEAQRQLERAEVEVELIDILEDQIYIESVRRVGEHGLPPNEEDVDEQIYNLRVVHNLTLKEIGDLVKKHESTVSKRLNANPRFTTLSAQDTKKVDRRRKDYDPKEVVERVVDKGEKAVDVATDMGISPATVSQVTKKAIETRELLDKTPVVVCADGFRFRDMFQYTTLKGKIDVEVNFQEDMVYIHGFSDNGELGVFGRFSRYYFDSYSVEEPLTWFVNGETIMKMFLLKQIQRADFVQLTLKADEMMLKYEGLSEGTYSHGDVKIRERPINSAFEELKEENIMKKNACKIRFKIDELKGMPESNRIKAAFKDGKLSLSGVSRGWKFEKEIDPIEFSGESVEIEVRSSILKRAISQQKYNVNMFLVDEDKKYLMLCLDGLEAREGFVVHYVVV